MERARDSPQGERGAPKEGAPSIPAGPGSASPVPMFSVLNCHGRRDAAPSSGEYLPPKQPFTVRLKDIHEWTAARRPHETLHNFVAEVNRNAHLLNLIDDDERVLRLQLPGTPPKDLDVDATLGDVRICIGVKDDHPGVLLAVIAKLPKDTGTGAGAPVGPEMNRDQSSVTVKGAPKGKGKGKGQPSAGAPSPSPSPSPEQSVVIKRRFDPDLRLTESDLNSDKHLTLSKKAESLSISLTSLKSARIELGLGRWLGRQERARLRRLRRSDEESRGSPAGDGAEREPIAKQARTEGQDVTAACKHEIL